MLDPQLYEMAFPHGLGLLVIRKAPACCPGCGYRQVLWVSWPAELNEVDSCLACATQVKRRLEARSCP